MQTRFRRLAAAATVFWMGLAAAEPAPPVVGAGSSAAFPVYRAWAEQYSAAGGTALQYDPAGSSAGLKRIRAREVDFGASDVAPSAAELERDGLVVFPTVITGVIPVFNLPKIGQSPLVLDGATLAAIFAGDIASWDDARLRRLNPGLALPAQPIVAVDRADGSGTTYNFSRYLAGVDTGWQQRMGVGTKLPWPARFTAVKGSRAVAETVAATPGSIGYVDFNYVAEHALGAARMRLADGSTVDGTPNAFKTALMHSAWWTRGDFTQPLTGIAAAGAWPITMGTFVVMPRVAADPARTLAALRLFLWAFNYGDETANRVRFVRLPDTVQAKAFRAMAQIRDRDGVPLAVGEISIRPPEALALR